MRVSLVLTAQRFVTGIYPSTIRTGGDRHAWIKGNLEAEYSWFSLGDGVPGVATSAEKAARLAIRGIQGGDYRKTGTHFPRI